MALWDAAALAERDQFEFWHEVICRAFVPLTPVRTDRGTGFAGRVETRPLGRLTRARLSSQAQHTEHGPREVAATTDEWFFVNLQLSGRCRVRVEGSDAVAEPGEYVVVDTTRPYWFDMDGTWEMLSYRVPHAALSALGAGPPRTGQVVRPGGLGGVVISLMHSLWDAGDGSTGAEWDVLGAAFAGALAVTVPREPVPFSRAALRGAVTAYVDRHLTDRELSVTAVCRGFAVSTRTLHNAFAEGEGGTFAATVRARRLDRCAELLGDPAIRATVAQVAAGHGFDDATSFSRAFRRRFGISPRDVRARTCTNGTTTVHPTH